MATGSMILRKGRLASGVAEPVIAATDGELLMRFARYSDEAAFAEIVERRGRLVWLVCSQILRQRQDVEDAFQATFLILAQRATAIRASDSAAAWLFKVAQRTALAARRKRTLRKEEPLVAELHGRDDVLPLLHDCHMRYVLLQELRCMPAKYQTPLVLRYLDGQSRRSIAEQMDLTVGQVQGRLARGRRMLRSRLVRRGVSLSLAAGTLSAATTNASAAVTPTMVCTTAKTCLALKITGATGGISVAAIELAREGVKAMWYASFTKFAAIVVPIVAGVGVAFGAQGGDDRGDGAGRNGTVELQISGTESGTAEAAAPVAVAAQQADPGAVAAAAASDAKAELKKSIGGRQDAYKQLMQERVEEMVELEMQKLAKTFAQREVEAIHKEVLNLKSMEFTHPEMSEVEREKWLRHRDMLDHQFENAIKELESVTLRVFTAESELESLQAEIAQSRNELSKLEQAEFTVDNRDVLISSGTQVHAALPVPVMDPYRRPAAVPYQVPQALADNGSSDSGALRPGEGVEVTLAPRDRTQAAQVLRTVVDSKGQIQIDQSMAPIKIAGFDPERAGMVIRDFFGTPTSRYQDVRVRRVSQPADYVKFSPAPVTDDQFQKALLKLVEGLQENVEQLREENERLRSQIEAMPKPARYPAPVK